MGTGIPGSPGQGAGAGSGTGGTAGCSQPCKPCIPAVGTVAYRLDKVPPSTPHKPFTGDHWHLFKVNQNPKTCRCFWNKTGEVGEGPIPAGAIPMTGAIGGGGR